jgi:hypothetical protein
MNMPVKKILIIMAAAVALMAVNSRLHAKPVDVSIGGTALYNWWNPYWNNHKIVIQTQDLRRVVDTRAPRYSVIQQFLYGPDVSIKFLGNWEISPSFQYGEASTKGGNVAFYPMNMFPFLNPMYRTISMEIKQYDIYSSFGYYFLKYFKCYLGLRVDIINNSISYKHLDLNPLFPPNELFVLEMYMKTLHITPEAGFNIILPISDTVSFICAVSGTFQSGSNRSDYGKTYSIDGLMFNPKINFRSILRDIYLAAGCNTSMAFKITIPVVNISVTMGGYYRMLRYFQTNHNRGVFDLDGSYEHKYGFAYSVAYTFSFGQRKIQNLWIPRPNY